MADQTDTAAPGGADVLDEWLTRDALAADLGVQPMTLRRWASEGLGPPFVKVGRKALYRKEAVREWMCTRERGGRR